ncbi:sodium channel, voltage-gated, type IV, beta b [Lampris incognitus]|uniref:sodium channel, voltage-gated, type IV, beta b n=1 Tax=Lampris incognitus TaxID=2546036 RepID=UPI0024B4FAB2|nr:sodium channel, voltage-gated, type IV, beta b [Lampris incognitus]
MGREGGAERGNREGGVGWHRAKGEGKEKLRDSQRDKAKRGVSAVWALLSEKRSSSPPAISLCPLSNLQSLSQECCGGWQAGSLHLGQDLIAMDVQWNRAEATSLFPKHTAPGVMFSLLLGVWSAQALEMSVGKIPFLEAVNGSTVMLPCTYASCIGIKNLYFSWQFNNNGTMIKMCDSIIPAEGVEPDVNIERDRVEFVGSSKTNNISILLWNITFDDQGQYTCFGRNPKEKGKNHSAIFTLTVVDELRVVDNTLTIIIASAVGGAIALLMGFMLLKNFTLFVLATLEEKNKECLVTSSGIDNTENGLSGSKADSKSTPKKK